MPINVIRSLSNMLHTGGATAGATDEFGVKALEEQIPLRDVHATILNLLARLNGW